MKKVFLLLAISVLTLSAAAQDVTINEVPLKSITVDYLQIVGTSKSFSNKVTISIDYGQHTKLISAKGTSVKDEAGKVVAFNSMIDALNFLSKHGYEFVNSNLISVGGQNVYHYLLKRKE